jgi:putative membrane protein
MSGLTHVAVSFGLVTLAVLAASKLFSDVKVARFQTAIGVALVFGILNLFVGWFIKLVVGFALLPAALVTFGLAFLLLGFLANSILLWLTDKLVKGFEISSLRGLFGTALLVGLAQWLLSRLASGS